MPPTDVNPLALDEKTMKQIGYRAIDILVEHHLHIRDKPVVPALSSAESLAQELKSFAGKGKDPIELINRSIETVFADCMQLVHPRFYAYIPGCTNFVSVIADLMSSGFNVFAGTAPQNLGPYEIECATIRWLCELTGMDEKAGGLFVSGGSVASLTALAVARQVILNNEIDDAVIYYSDQTHSSIDRALFILGFKKKQIREITTDSSLRLCPQKLESLIRDDRAAGRRPFCVVGNAGTTNSGAIDPLADLSVLCKKESMWFHVDAAYGGGALLADSVRAQFAGIENSDSIALDPHKWLFQAYECGCVLVRDPVLLRDTFRRIPDYMKDSDAGPGIMNFRDMSPQVTRSFRAYKLWLSLQVFGIDAFKLAVEKGLEMARYAEQIIQEGSHWEIITPATLGVVTFRFVDDRYNEEQLNEFNGGLIQKINDDGFAFFSSTIMFNKKVNRICPLNPGLTKNDIEKTIEKLESIATAMLNAS